MTVLGRNCERSEEIPMKSSHDIAANPVFTIGHATRPVGELTPGAEPLADGTIRKAQPAAAGNLPLFG
jgi:hypothetical protein